MSNVGEIIDETVQELFDMLGKGEAGTELCNHVRSVHM